jgi:hypothetical protein
MKFILTPDKKSAGKLRIGMTIEEVRYVLGKTPEVSLKQGSDGLPSDYFAEDGFFVYYKKPGIVEAIEFSDDTIIELNNQNLFDLSHTELLDFLKKEDLNVAIERESLTSERLGISAWIPDSDENGSARSIIIFDEGYYT